MSVPVRRSLFGALFGLVVGVAAEGIRYGLGDRRSLGEMLFMVIGLMVIGLIATLFRISKKRVQGNVSNKD
ncbi:hypothetical protein SAMN04489740_2837 [Arthrobacter alpinus]|uniref:Uncharacterized protein n=1 Tax=Arthrobacter alpinus TaxID=656366 RepID=A0A1H5MA34_9MICC|nr:hypothetical protein SAMN04489740_2837 [Arthrobacter alpinus]